MQIIKPLKCGISPSLMRILPLSEENKNFLLNSDAKVLDKHPEYSDLLKSIYEFKRHYMSSPWVVRDEIKNSFKKEINSNCDKLRCALQAKENLQK